MSFNFFQGISLGLAIAGTLISLPMEAQESARQRSLGMPRGETDLAQQFQMMQHFQNLVRNQASLDPMEQLQNIDPKRLQEFESQLDPEQRKLLEQLVENQGMLKTLNEVAKQLGAPGGLADAEGDSLRDKLRSSGMPDRLLDKVARENPGIEDLLEDPQGLEKAQQLMEQFQNMQGERSPNRQPRNRNSNPRNGAAEDQRANPFPPSQTPPPSTSRRDAQGASDGGRSGEDSELKPEEIANPFEDLPKDEAEASRELQTPPASPDSRSNFPNSRNPSREAKDQREGDGGRDAFDSRTTPQDRRVPSLDPKSQATPGAPARESDSQSSKFFPDQLPAAPPLPRQGATTAPEPLLESGERRNRYTENGRPGNNPANQPNVRGNPGNANRPAVAPEEAKRRMRELGLDAQPGADPSSPRDSEEGGSSNSIQPRTQPGLSGQPRPNLNSQGFRPPSVESQLPDGRSPTPQGRPSESMSDRGTGSGASLSTDDMQDLMRRVPKMSELMEEARRDPSSLPPLSVPESSMSAFREWLQKKSNQTEKSDIFDKIKDSLPKKVREELKKEGLEQALSDIVQGAKQDVATGDRDGAKKTSPGTSVADLAEKARKRKASTTPVTDGKRTGTDSRVAASDAPKGNQNQNPTKMITDFFKTFTQGGEEAGEQGAGGAVNGSAGASPSGGGGMGTVGASSWIWLALLAAFVGVIVLFKFNFERDAIKQRKVQVTKQLSELTIRTRADVVRAFHLLALSAGFTGQEIEKWWTHRRVATQLVAQTADESESVTALTQLYEIARYEPAEKELSDEQLTRARKAMERLMPC